MNVEENLILFYEFLTHRGNILKNYTPRLSSKSDYFAVILETRKDEHIESIMKNVMYYLNETNSPIKWGLQILHGNGNENYIKEITKDWGEIEYVNLGIDTITKLEYSEMMKTPDFWKMLYGEKILIFQKKLLFRLLATMVMENLLY